MTPGDIYLTRDAAGKARPVIVVSKSKFNRGDYYLGVPLTTARLHLRRSLPNCVLLGKGAFGLWKECVAQADGLSLFRRTDLIRKNPHIGTVSGAKLEELIGAVGYVIGADCRPIASP